MSRTWRIVMVAMLVLAGSLGTAAAQGKPDDKGGSGGGPGTGEQCLDANGNDLGTVQVVLDPGHGGGDPGATDPFHGQREADLTLDIAYQTMYSLQGSGYSVALTRYGDVGLENSQRGAIANACGAEVFIEIHLNASTDTSVNFTQTFWGKKRKDLEFSDVMYQSLVGSLGIPGNGVGQFANGGLLHAEAPSTLVEAVFLSNKTEADRLLRGERQPQIAQAIADGIVWWLTP